MTEPAYSATRAAAESVHAHLVRHAARARVSPPSQLATLPGAATIELIIDAAFRASLRREEGRTPQLSLAFVAPTEVRRAVNFERPLALLPQPLTRIAPAVERAGIHLAVWPEEGKLYVWGATRTLPAICFVLEVIAPGLLVIKHSPAEESGKFVNVAVLEGDEIKFVDQATTKLTDCPDLLNSLLGFESRHEAPDSVNVLLQLAVSMRAHGRGGSLLVVPTGSNAWQESMAQPIMYSVAPPFAGLAELMQEPPAERAQRWWQDALLRAVDAIAGLTGVDGATIITDRYELLAFGTRIIRRPACDPVSRVIVTESIEGSVAQIMEPSQLGGTRHLYAAQFEQDQHDAIALIASQDGRFTVFAWSPCEDMVHAHRIEALLL